MVPQVLKFLNFDPSHTHISEKTCNTHIKLDNNSVQYPPNHLDLGNYATIPDMDVDAVWVRCFMGVDNSDLLIMCIDSAS